MKRSQRTVVLAAAIAVAWAGTTGAVFVLAGPQPAVFSLAAGVPVLAIGGFLYLRGTPGSLERLQDDRAADVGERFAGVYGAYRDISEADPALLADVDVPVERVLDDLESEGISYDRETGTTSVSLLGSPDPDRLSSLEAEIDDLEDRLERGVVAAVRDEIREINTQLRRLEGVVDVQVPRRPDDVPGPADRELQGESWWETLLEELAAHREDAREELGRGAESIRASIRQADADGVAVEDQIRRAESAENIERGVEALLAARDTLRQEAGGTVQDRRRELLALAAAVRSSDAGEYVDASRMEEFEAAVEEVEWVDDPTEMDALGRRGDRLRSICTDIIRDLEGQLATNIETLRTSGVPDDYYRRPDATEHNYAAAVAATDSLEAYRSEWISAARALTEALADTASKARVASMYDDISQQIDARLRRQGAVTAADLPVKHDEEQFLGLYARTHDVAFDPSVPELTAAGGAERYTLTARVSFEDGGEERTVHVSVHGRDYEATRTVRTYLADVVEFEEVPYGEHTVRAEPATDDNEPAAASVTVESDTAVDLEMPRVTLRERLCDGLDEGDVDTYLAEMADRFADTFESEGYLTTGTEFPIADEFVPCLLATWADEHGHSVTRTDADVLVYDAETVSEELTMVGRHNLDPGDSMAYGTLRERFLSAPVPDEAIRKTAADIESLIADDNALHKRD